MFVDQDNRSLNAALLRFGGRDARLPYSRDDYATLARDFRPRALSEHKLLAPHFVQRVLATEKGRDEIVTTLDLAKQQLIERRIADYVRTNRGRGIQNAAALLVDTRDMDVLAQVGSADLFNADIQGQVDGTRSPRSQFHSQTVRLCARPGAEIDSSIVDLSDAPTVSPTTIRKISVANSLAPSVPVTLARSPRLSGRTRIPVA